MTGFAEAWVVPSPPVGGDRRVRDLRAVADLPVEDDLQGAGAAEVEVAGDQGAEKGTGVTGRAEHDGAGDLDLGHRAFPPVPGLPVGGTQRQREPVHPPLEEHPMVAGCSASQILCSSAGSSQAANPPAAR